jgi:hypothetical protein
LSLVTAFIVIFKPNDVVFAEIRAELDFDERKRSVCAVAEAMVGLWRDVYVFAFAKTQMLFSADDIGCACDDDPVLAAMCMSLQAQARAGFNLKSFDLVAVTLF